MRARPQAKDQQGGRVFVMNGAPYQSRKFRQPPRYAGRTTRGGLVGLSQSHVACTASPRAHHCVRVDLPAFPIIDQRKVSRRARGECITGTRTLEALLALTLLGIRASEGSLRDSQGRVRESQVAVVLTRGATANPRRRLGQQFPVFRQTRSVGGNFDQEQ